MATGFRIFWEIQNSLDAHNPDGDEGRAGDKDADGVSAVLEYLAGLNATDPNDGLSAIMPQVLRNGALWQLQFPVIPNRVYQVESRGLDALFAPVGAPFTVPAADAAHLWTDPQPATDERLYRVRISLP